MCFLSWCSGIFLYPRTWERMLFIWVSFFFWGWFLFFQQTNSLLSRKGRSSFSAAITNSPFPAWNLSEWFPQQQGLILNKILSKSTGSVQQPLHCCLWLVGLLYHTAVVWNPLDVISGPCLSLAVGGWYSGEITSFKAIIPSILCSGKGAIKLILKYVQSVASLSFYLCQLLLLSRIVGHSLHRHLPMTGGWKSVLDYSLKTRIWLYADYFRPF